MADVPQVEWVSPSAVARMQACGLAESRRRRSKLRAPSNPLARLGNAAHRVFEWIASEAPTLCGSDSEQRIAARWRDECSTEASESQANALESSWGSVERWPGYGRIAAGLRVDGAALALELAPYSKEHRLAEHPLATADGRIRGTADLLLIDGEGKATIIDHKVGAVGPDDSGPGGKYEQQVLLYAAMARDAGLRPASAEIRPIGRPSVRIELSDAALAEAVREAGAQLDRYNAMVSSGREVDLATPSETSCRWCPFILDCPAIWVDPPPELGELAVAEGVVSAVQVSGSSVSLSLDRSEGTLVITGLPLGDATGRQPAAGDAIRIGGLKLTVPGRARPHPGLVRMLIQA